MALEFELKLAADPDTLDAIFSTRLPDDWQGTPWQEHALENHYFDTDDGELFDRKIALRIRKKNDTWIQTIKTAGEVTSGVHQRQEFNHSLSECKLDPSGLPDTEWGGFVAAKMRSGALETVFLTHFTRRSRVLTHHSGTRIEIALDAGYVSAQDEQELFYEVELELLEGEVGPLFTLGHFLIAHHPLVPDSRSKAERGYRLLDWHRAPVERLEALQLQEEASFWQILRLGLNQAWGHWQRYGKEFVCIPSVQSVEQMRRAVGLMRHMLVCFHRFPVPPQVRAWRVFLTHMLRAMHWVRFARAQIAADRIILSSHGENYLPHQEELEDILPDEREFSAGVEAVQQLISSRQYARFALEMAEFLLVEPAADPALLEPAAESATALVVRQWEDLQAIWRHAPIDPDFTYYAQQRRLLRRALWSALLFGDLFEDKPRDLFIDPCRDLLAGVEDTATLNSLEQMAEALIDEQRHEVGLWLSHQRETLWTAVNMTRDRALRAEPDDLDSE